MQTGLFHDLLHHHKRPYMLLQATLDLSGSVTEYKVMRTVGLVEPPVGKKFTHDELKEFMKKDKCDINTEIYC